MKPHKKKSARKNISRFSIVNDETCDSVERFFSGYKLPSDLQKQIGRLKKPWRHFSIAYTLAKKAHSGQFRELPDGRPYIEHCKDVAALMPTWELKTVAILHDIIEDTPITAADLLKVGIPEHIVKAVEAMTKPDKESASGQELADYAAYIRGLKKASKLAATVKLADNYVNLKDRIAGVIAGAPDADDHRKAIAKYAIGMGILVE